MATPKRDGKVWRIQLSVAGRRENATFKTAVECRDWAERRRRELKAEAGGRGGEVHSLGAALKRYADEVAPGHKGERWEAVRIARMVHDLPVTLPLASITPEHVIAWRDKRLTQVAPASVAREMNLLASVFTHARREWRWIATSPMADVTRPSAGKPRDRIITASETRRLLRALRFDVRRRPQTLQQIVGAVFLLALRSGMRSSEITSLRWSRVRESWVTLPQTKNGSARDVPLGRSSMRLIERMRGLDDVLVLPVGPQTRDALFRAARDRAGLEGFRFHDARHTAATRIGATVGQPGRLSFPEFCRVLGWKSPAMALVYVNPTPEQLSRKL